MSKLAKSFQDLEVYQEAFRFQQEIFNMTKQLPVEERFSLTDQIRRSSRAIGVNIAESCSYLSEAELQRFNKAYLIGRLLGSAINNYESFCTH